MSKAPVLTHLRPTSMVRIDIGEHHSEESERAVLGAILLEPTLLPQVRVRLQGVDFYSLRNGQIFETYLRLEEQGRTIDLRTVQADLEQRRLFSEVGGVAYLTSLDLDLPDPGRVDTYVEIIKEKAVRRSLVKHCVGTAQGLADGADTTASLSQAIQELRGLLAAAAPNGPRSIGDLVDCYFDELEERGKDGLMGFSTGYPAIDDLGPGLGKNHLWVVAGRPGMGKTTWTLNFLRRLSILGSVSSAFFSLEMNEEELTHKLLCIDGGLLSLHVMQGLLSKAEFRRLVEAGNRLKVQSDQLHIAYVPRLTLDDLEAKARRLKVEKGLQVLAVDYLQLMAGSTRRRSESRKAELSEITRGMKQLAGELGIGIVLLSQMNREVERRGGDRRPILSDLAESGATEQDADLVAFVHRPEVYEPERFELRGLAEFLIRKYRHGRLGEPQIGFDGGTGRFFPLKKAAIHEGPDPF